MSNTVPLSSFYPEIYPFAPNLPDPTIDQALIRAARKLCSESWYVLRYEDVTTTPADFTTSPPTLNNIYQLTDGVTLELVAIKNWMLLQPNGIWIPGAGALGPDIDPNLQPGIPRGLQLRPPNEVRIAPPPFAAYTFRVGCVVQPVIGASVLPIELSRKYYRGVAAGALEWLLKIPGDSQNMQMAGVYGAEFKSAISNAKADAQRGNTFGTLRVRPKPFIV